LAQAVEPGQALTVLAAAKDEGVLMQPDLALLERQARERDAVTIARHHARLAGKEQDDLAAFARGELPEPLSEHSFTLVHGAQGATDAYARYLGARKEGEATAAIRGKDAEGIEAARAEWKDDPAVFERAVAKDVQLRLRDPAGYALETVPGAKAAWDESPEAERSALLRSAQAAAGIPEDQRSLWTLAQEAEMADEWDSLPSGHGGRSGRLAFLRKHILGLPAGQQQFGIARLVRQGIIEGTTTELTETVQQFRDGRINPARRLAGIVGARTAAASTPNAASLSDQDDGRATWSQQTLADHSCAALSLRISERVRSRTVHIQRRHRNALAVVRSRPADLCTAPRRQRAGRGHRRVPGA
jgi:hypothetical protein